MKTTITALLLCITALSGFTQEANPAIDGLLAKMNTVKDYSVEALITSDIPMVKILPSRATIYFKQKDKFKIDSKGIAILPKQGFTDIAKLLADKNSYTAVTMGSETIAGAKAEIVSVFPVSDTSDLVLAKLWIDTNRDIILKSQITTRSSGMVTIAYTYGNQVKWGLPDRMIFTVDVKKFKIPKGVATDINRTKTPDPDKPVAKTGQVKIELTGYKVNLGIRDEVFSKRF
jgi:outer membrane lipoprotein-sorting protein